MWYSATVHAYDVMDRVQITARVTVLTPGPDQTISPVIVFSTTLEGVGEADPQEWLRDALIGLLEDI